MVEDAADDAALGDECDHPHHALAAGTDERIGLVDPTNQLSPSTPKSGERGGDRRWRRRRMNARSRGEGLCLLGLALGLEFPAHHVRIGAVVMDQVPSRVGNVGEEPSDEVEGVERLGLLVVVTGPGQVRGGG